MFFSQFSFSYPLIDIILVFRPADNGCIVDEQNADQLMFLFVLFGSWVCWVAKVVNNACHSFSAIQGFLMG